MWKKVLSEKAQSRQKNHAGINKKKDHDLAHLMPRGAGLRF